MKNIISYKTIFVFFAFAGLLMSCQKEVEQKKEITQSEEVKTTTIKSVPTDRLMGKIDPPRDENFTLIDMEHAGRQEMYMQKEAYAAFVKMYDAAKKEGIKLVIRSATRSFLSQKMIWEGKWTGRRLVEGGENLADSTPDPVERAKKILLWSSMPGTSRHHWGTDIDINAFTNDYFESGEGKKIYDWMQAHAHEYGFCQPYTAKGKDRPHGYNEERWHWSYMPIAKPYLEAIKRQIENKDITGFKGSETAQEIDVKNKYILGVHAGCTGH